MVLVVVFASACSCCMTGLQCECTGTSGSTPRAQYLRYLIVIAQAQGPLSCSSPDMNTDCSKPAVMHALNPLACLLASLGSLVSWRVFPTCSATVDKH